ncbi:MAG: dGTP triphosphohydrolase [Bryobacteraceae bacterium]|jgi:dGTPase
MLGYLRFPVECSRGRRYPESAHPYRNAFQRDRDRIVHARAFRRLEAKTQVFTPGLCDHFRNRLTHTIEVAQIARTVAAVLALDEDLTEALALAHDIGHPPFSHAGEDALDQQMKRFGSRFDHNQHAVRIVEIFEQRYARFPGLNLSFEVREGIAKHSRDFGPGENLDLEEYLPGLRPPLEAQLIDLADEIAYNTADLDDAVAAGLLHPAEVAAEAPYYRELYEAAEQQFPGAPESARFHETLRCLIDALVSGLIEGTVRRASNAGIRTVEDVRRHPARLAAFTPETETANRDLKLFLHRRVYTAPALREERDRAAAMIAELFEFFVAHPERLPAAHSELIPGEPAYRVVCDYIAGMTDGFFLRTYRENLESA